MTKIQGSMYLSYLLLGSLFFNILLTIKLYQGTFFTLTWTKEAAEEAEAVAAIPCSGHGRAYLDGLTHDDHGGQKLACECNTCYGGVDCSEFIPGCPANAKAVDPLFMEPFWLQHPSSTAVVVSGWHRMSYTFNDDTYISAELEKQIRKLHEVVGNAETAGKFVVFGVGATQLLNAAVHALSLDNSSTPAKVVASMPNYGSFGDQTKYFQSVHFSFQGDATLWKNNTDANTIIIEFVTSPNNPDGQPKKAVLRGPNVKTIYDRAYYWPHYTAIPSPADEDIMIFSLSKLTGHSGSRFGWALVKNEVIYQRMLKFVRSITIGVSRETRLRTIMLLRVVLERREGMYLNLDTRQ